MKEEKLEPQPAAAINDAVRPPQEVTPAQDANAANDSPSQQPQATTGGNEQPQRSKWHDILSRLQVSDATAASARAILEPLERGADPGEGLVKLIVSALTHDEDVKNAEAAGYLRGRNETIEIAAEQCDNTSPTPVNFPVYRKRSFWDR